MIYTFLSHAVTQSRSLLILFALWFLLPAFAQLKYNVPPGDFDGDGHADILVIRTSNSMWYWRTRNGEDGQFQHGQQGDIYLPMDADGDGVSEAAIYRPGTHSWEVRKQDGTIVESFQLGAAGGLPLVGNYSWGNIDEAAVFVPAQRLGEKNRFEVRKRGGIGGGYITFYNVEIGSFGDLPVVADFDGDGYDDFAVFRPSLGIGLPNEYIIEQSSNGTVSVPLGDYGGVPVCADYDGDGIVEPAVYQKNGDWIIQLTDGTVQTYNFGGHLADIPIPGKYDYDDKADLAVFREGQWLIQRSSIYPKGTRYDYYNTAPIRWGNEIYHDPVIGDWDGDGADDLALFEPASATWYLWRSTAGPATYQYGIAGDIAVPEDYDNDGIMDTGVFRGSNGTWYRYGSQVGGMQPVVYGFNGVVPVPGDYVWGNEADLALTFYNGGALEWHLGFGAGIPYGITNDVPIPDDYDGDGKLDLAVYRASNNTLYWNSSKNGGTTPVPLGYFGTMSYVVPGDYDGDTAAEVAVVRNVNGHPSVWDVHGGNPADYTPIQDKVGVPAVGDFDGDSKADPAIFGNGEWWILESSSGWFKGSPGSFSFGVKDDIPNGLIIADPDYSVYDYRQPILFAAFEGTIEDLTGNTVLAPVNGPSVQTQINDEPIILGDYLHLNGAGASVTIPSFELLNTSGPYLAKTISLWFRPATLTGGRQVLFEVGGAPAGFNIYLDNNTLYAGGWDRTLESSFGDQETWPGTWMQQTLPDANRWYHVVLMLDARQNPGTLEGGVFLAYLDDTLMSGSTLGMQMGTYAQIGALGRVFGGTRFHDGTTSASGTFQGDLDEIMVWNRVFETIEVEYGATERDLFFWMMEYYHHLDVDMYADDDGDELDNWTEFQHGTNPTLENTDGDGFDDRDEILYFGTDPTVADSPQHPVTPASLNLTVDWGTALDHEFSIINPTGSSLTYHLLLTGNVVPGYSWDDSVQGGIPYSWSDISETGTLLAGISGIDDGSEQVSFSQFEFPFYGRTYAAVWVSSNGYINFGEQGSPGSNRTLPDPDAPAGIIAPFWGDINPSLGGEIYVQEEPGRFIVQYESVAKEGGTGFNTFQVILSADGSIELHYKEMGEDNESCTLGIQNVSTTQGLQLRYNTDAANVISIQDAYAIRIMPQTTMCSLSALQVTVEPLSSASISLDMDLANVLPGEYTGNLQVTYAGNDTHAWDVPFEVKIPYAKMVSGPPETVIWEGEHFDSGNQEPEALVADTPYEVDRVEFYAHPDLFLSQDTTVSGGTYGNMDWESPPAGDHQVFARVVMANGQTNDSLPVLYTVIADSDGDRLEDGWEMAHFGNLDQDAFTDTDQDGASNLHEYEAGTNPLDDTDAPENLPTTITLTSPTNGGTVFEGVSIELRASVEDEDYGVKKVEFLANDIVVATDYSVNTSASGSYKIPISSTGPLTILARATDRFGVVAVSESITITILTSPDADGDGLTDDEEAAQGTDPHKKDSDDDGLSDGFESEYGFDPLDPQTVDGIPDALSDGDEDGLLAYLEEARGTDPTKKHTDNDGKDDFMDAVGYDPFFTFTAAPEVSYAVIVISETGSSTGSPLSVNNLGDVVYSDGQKLNRWLGAEMTAISSDGGDVLEQNNTGHVLYSKNRGLYAYHEGQSVLLHQGVDASNEGLVNDQLILPEDPDEVPYWVGDFSYDDYKTSAVVLGLEDTGTHYIRKYSSLDHLEQRLSWEQGLDWDNDGIEDKPTSREDLGEEGVHASSGGRYLALSEATYVAGQMYPGSAFTFVADDGYWGVTGEDIDATYHETRDALWTMLQGNPELTYIDTNKTYSFVSHQGDWIRTEGLLDLRFDRLIYYKKELHHFFSDGTDVDTTKHEERLEPLLLARLPDQDGLWKFWKVDNQYVFTDDDPSDGQSIFHQKIDTQNLVVSKAAENGLMLTTQGIWRNGRLLTQQDLIGDDPQWANLSVSSISDDGTFLAGTVDHHAVNPDGTQGAFQGTKVIMLVPQIRLLTDANRDLQIDERDWGVITKENPWRWWYNDDEDSRGEDATNEYDQPNSHIQDGMNGQINNVRDLLDFYPVALDLKTYLNVFAKEDYEYRVSLHDDMGETEPKGSFLITEQRITPNGYSSSDPDSNRAGEYHTNIQLAEGLAETNLMFFDNHLDGYTKLPNDFLTRIEADGSGVILVEHASGYDHPAYGSDPSKRVQVLSLRMEIIRPANDTLPEVMVARGDLPLSISNVEEMFTHKDLRGVVIGQEGVKTPLDWGGAWDRYTEENEEPGNYPDDLTDDTAFISVHGYNNNLRASRGGNAEMFKRLHVMGNRAKFYAVSWYGYESQFYLTKWLCPDYQKNVVNAFNTALAFKNYVADLNQSSLVVGAHSLGNMVVSSAIQDHGLDIDTYFLINAAVSAESYANGFSNTIVEDMIHRLWVGYYDILQNDQATPEQVELVQNFFTWNWHRLFDQNDTRRKLTWNGRFSDVTSRTEDGAFRTNVFNFWSRGDRTFLPHPQDANPQPPTDAVDIWEGVSAWARQEKRKGLGGTANDDVGGWEFNIGYKYPLGPTDIMTPFNSPIPIEQIQNPFLIPVNQLKSKPFFQVGNLDGVEDDAYFRLFDPDDTESAENLTLRNHLLAMFVPAKVLGMGGSASVNGFQDQNIKREYEMQDDFQNDAWYDDEKFISGRYWDHGDFKVIAMPYVYRLYEEFIKIGDLK